MSTNTSATTDRFAPIAAAADKLKATAIIDGEVIVPDEHG